MSKEITDILNYYKEKHDWESIARIFNLKEDYIWFKKYLTKKELSDLVFGIAQHISEMTNDFNKHKQSSNFVLAHIIEEYLFVKKIIENIDYDRKIYISFAYINAKIFSSKLNIKKVSKDISGLNAIKYYSILLKKEPTSIDILYLYGEFIVTMNDKFIGKLLKKIDNSQIELINSKKWIISDFKRSLKAREIFNKIILLYENLNDNEDRRKFFREYVRSEYMLIKIIYQKYNLKISAKDVFKCISKKNILFIFDNTDVIEKDINLINTMVEKILKQLNLPNNKLSLKEVEKVINKKRLPVKVSDIYYIQGCIKILLAKCMLMNIVVIKNKYIEIFVNYIEEAINSFENVFYIKSEKNKIRKIENVTFLWGVEHIAFCYSVLGMLNFDYMKKLNNIIDMYETKKGINSRNIKQYLYYYRGLYYIYNEENFNKLKAIKDLSYIKDKSFPLYEEVKELLINLKKI